MAPRTRSGERLHPLAVREERCEEALSPFETLYLRDRSFTRKRTCAQHDVRANERFALGGRYARKAVDALHGLDDFDVIPERLEALEALVPGRLAARTQNLPLRLRL